jgi:hypothetical protein
MIGTFFKRNHASTTEEPHCTQVGTTPTVEPPRTIQCSSAIPFPFPNPLVACPPLRRLRSGDHRPLRPTPKRTRMRDGVTQSPPPRRKGTRSSTGKERNQTQPHHILHKLQRTLVVVGKEYGPSGKHIIRFIRRRPESVSWHEHVLNANKVKAFMDEAREANPTNNNIGTFRVKETFSNTLSHKQELHTPPQSCLPRRTGSEVATCSEARAF